MSDKFKDPPDFSSIVNLIRKLRSEKGCPWDRKQTPETMITCLLNEAYELQDAINSDEKENILDEAGDVLFQLVFIFSLYMEKGYFKIEDIISKNIKKNDKPPPPCFRK